MENNSFSPLLAFFLGLVPVAVTWAFSEFSQSRRLSEARRAEINRAIHTLLEFRHCLRATSAICRHLAGKLKVDPRMLEREILPRVMGTFLPANAAANYAKAIDALAAHDPYLAFTMSGHGRLPDVINLPQLVASGIPAGGPELDAVAQSLRSFSMRLSDLVAQGGIGTLEGAILALAEASSRKLARDLRRQFAEGRNGIDLNVPEMEQYLAQVDRWLAEIIALSASQPSAETSAPRPAG